MRALCTVGLCALSFMVVAANAQAQSASDDIDGSDASRDPVSPALERGSESPRDVDAPGEDESIYVVQRRAYSKKGKFEITPSFFSSVNNKFVGHRGPALSIAYHLRENFALEIMGTPVMDSYYSSLVLDVRALDPPLEPQRVDLKRMRQFGGISAQFSALYGKFDFYNWLVDYDFYVLAGVGFANTIEVCSPPNRGTCGESRADIGYGQRSPEDGADQFKITGNLGGGIRVFFADFVGLRIEFRDIVYADRATEPGGTTTDIRNNLLLFLGLSFLI